MKRIKPSRKYIPYEFNVGDTVKVKSWKDMESEFGTTISGEINCFLTFVYPMREYCGKIFRIKALHGVRGSVELEPLEHVSNLDWNFSTDMIVPYTPSKKELEELTKASKEILEEE